jgi:carbamoylphosphate synthase small subunit
LDDKITIDHYKENGQQDLAKPVSGVNKLIENSNHKTMSGGVITHQEEKLKHRLDKEFLLKYFQEHDIKEISLIPEGNLLIEYNSGKSEIITSDQANSQKLQKVISYYQENNRTNLNRKDLINKSNSNLPTANPKNNNALLVGFGIGGALVIGMSIGLLLKKRNVKKH